MRQQPTNAPFHVRLDSNGNIVGAGRGPLWTPQPGQTIRGFESFGERESDPDVQAWRRSLYDQGNAGKVEDMKSVLAYAAKRQDAQSILRGDTYDPAIHDAIAIEITRCDCTPIEAANDIMAASMRDVISIEDERVELRELLRNDAQ